MRTALLFSKLFILSGLLLFQACGSDASDETSGNEGTVAPTESIVQDQADPGTATFITDDELYAWVDNLNIRDAPQLNGKIVAKANDKIALRFTGQRSDDKETL